MTPQVFEFVKRLNLKGLTLDVGSYDVNGSLRPLFAEYVGLDMRLGPNVDVVGKADSIQFPTAHFQNVCCCEMLEHCSNPFESVREMKRVLKTGGYLVLTVPGIFFPRHDYPNDYWRMTIDGLKLFFNDMGLIGLEESDTHVMGWGIKR